MLYQDWDLELMSERIRISPLTETDEDAYGKLMLGEIYERFQRDFGFKPKTGIHKTLMHTADDEEHAIRLPLDDRFIGWITLQRSPDGQPDIGISLVPECRNQGYGPEAVKLFGNHLFYTYGLTQVSIRIAKSNHQSQRAFAKVGAIFDHESIDERYSDMKDELKSSKGLPTEPRILHYRLPLPIAEIMEPSFTPEMTYSDQTGHVDEALEDVKALCIKELDELSEKILNRGNPNAQDVKQIIQETLKSIVV